MNDLFFKYRWQLSAVLVGFFLIALGIILLVLSPYEFPHSEKVEVIDNASETNSSKIVVEIAGSVINSGVYQFENGARIDDLLIKAGGLSESADREWVEKNLNKASKLVDGQKLYIPSIDEHSPEGSANNSGGYVGSNETLGVGAQSKININTASQNELESLWGIGPVTAQSIIEQRPYSNVEELLVKKIIKSNVYDKINSLITVY